MMRVLLVEDEPSQQESLSMLLKAVGFAVLQASDVEEALRMLEADFDAAILDVKMPDPKLLNRDGLTVLHRLRAKHPDIPVAVFTGQPLADDEVSFARHHRAKVMYKPQTYDVLIDFLSKSRPSPHHA
jgi:CheY-like chemotaxis protein